MNRNADITEAQRNTSSNRELETDSDATPKKKWSERAGNMAKDTFRYVQATAPYKFVEGKVKPALDNAKELFSMRNEETDRVIERANAVLNDNNSSVEDIKIALHMVQRIRLERNARVSRAALGTADAILTGGAAVNIGMTATAGAGAAAGGAAAAKAGASTFLGMAWNGLTGFVTGLIGGLIAGIAFLLGVSYYGAHKTAKGAKDVISGKKIGIRIGELRRLDTALTQALRDEEVEEKDIPTTVTKNGWINKGLSGITGKENDMFRIRKIKHDAHVDLIKEEIRKIAGQLDIANTENMPLSDMPLPDMLNKIIEISNEGLGDLEDKEVSDLLEKIKDFETLISSQLRHRSIAVQNGVLVGAAVPLAAVNVFTAGHGSPLGHATAHGLHHAANGIASQFTGDMVTWGGLGVALGGAAAVAGAALGVSYLKRKNQERKEFANKLLETQSQLREIQSNLEFFSETRKLYKSIKDSEKIDNLLKEMEENRTFKNSEDALKKLMDTMVTPKDPANEESAQIELKQHCKNQGIRYIELIKPRLDMFFSEKQAVDDITKELVNCKNQESYNEFYKFTHDKFNTSSELKNNKKDQHTEGQTNTMKNFRANPINFLVQAMNLKFLDEENFNRLIEYETQRQASLINEEQNNG